jgi:hypothetical protein
MSAGLPATGVGGALYLLLVIWMVLRELTGPAKGNHSARSRWPFIGKMVAISLVMVVVVLGERLLIQGVLKVAVEHMPGLAMYATLPSGSFVLLMAAMPFILLLLLMTCLHVLRLALASKSEASRDDLANASQSP